MTPTWVNAPGRMVMATLSVPDISTAEGLYSDCLRYARVEAGRIEEPLARSWGAPAMAGKAYVLMAPREADTYALRLVETAPVADFAPMRTFGWGALELSVESVEAVHEAVKDTAFRIIGPPRDIMFGAPVRPMQVSGPAREVFFLTQVLEPEEGPETARAFVDQLFIAILATPDRGKALEFYERALGFKRGATFDMAYRSLNQAFGLAPDTQQSFTMLGSPVEGVIQVDQYPTGATARPLAPGHLPPAIGMVSFVVASLDAVRGEFFAAPARFGQAPYGGRRAAALKGAAGEWIELVEAR